MIHGIPENTVVMSCLACHLARTRTLECGLPMTESAFESMESKRQFMHTSTLGGIKHRPKLKDSLVHAADVCVCTQGHK